MPRNLNSNQIAILEQMYYFRFVTTTALQKKLKPKYRESINSRLNILEKHKLIGRRYEKSYKLAGKPAVYYLLPESFSYLKEQDWSSVQTIKKLYNDRKASDSFIGHCLALLDVSNMLDALYGEKLEFFTATEIAEGYDHFPRPMPDAFLSYRKGPRSQPKSFFLHIVSADKPFFTTSKKLDTYVAYANSNKWDRSAEPLPSVLFVCENQTLEKRLNKHAERIDEQRPSYLKFFTTNIDRLKDMAEVGDDIWLALQSGKGRRLSLPDL